MAKSKINANCFMIDLIDYQGWAIVDLSIWERDDV